MMLLLFRCHQHLINVHPTNKLDHKLDQAMCPELNQSAGELDQLNNNRLTQASTQCIEIPNCYLEYNQSIRILYPSNNDQKICLDIPKRVVQAITTEPRTYLHKSRRIVQAIATERRTYLHKSKRVYQANAVCLH